ncbi:unnamed protein product [Phytomonas sp. Hart1]|nr:unnamed protein product [Phytomonas sp. Hart1]|eukprot:CCW68436.1 unnamed protein product [Phytomonas sp. isolate Hart1]
MYSDNPEDEVHQLLSGFQFFILCFFISACYYASLYISASAVGESTSFMTLPFHHLRRIYVCLKTSVMSLIHCRRNNIYVGVSNTDDVGAEETLINCNNRSSNVS